MSFDETYLAHDLGEKVAKDDLEAEPVFTLLEICCGLLPGFGSSR
jgi:GntR family transcriptional regulator